MCSDFDDLDLNVIHVETKDGVLAEQLLPDEVEVSRCSLWWDDVWLVADGEEGHVRAAMARGEAYLKRNSMILERIAATMSAASVEICTELLACDGLPAGWADVVTPILLEIRS